MSNIEYNIEDILKRMADDKADPNYDPYGGKTPFIVLGLPRSRTYWLSVFLECMHEGLFYYPNYNDYLNTTSRGDSTTCYEQIKDYITDLPKVIIHRNIFETIESMNNIGIKPDPGQLVTTVSHLNNIDGLHIEYNDIDSELETIWNFCREEPFDNARANNLSKCVLNNDFIISEVKQLLTTGN